MQQIVVRVLVPHRRYLYNPNINISGFNVIKLLKSGFDFKSTNIH